MLKSLFNRSFLLLLPLLSAFSIIYAPFKVNILLLAGIIFGILIVGILNYGNKYYNGHFIPVFIFIMFSMVLLSHFIIEITGNYFIDEMMLIPFFACAVFSTAEWPLEIFSKINNKLFWSFLFFFFTAGIVSTIINQVPLNISIKGGLLISKPIIVFVIFMLFSFTPYSKIKFHRLLNMFCIGLCLAAIMWSLIFEVILSFNPAPGRGMVYEEFIGLPVFRSFFKHPVSYSSVMIPVCNYFFSLFLYTRKKNNFLFFAIASLGLLSTVRAKVIIMLPLTCTVIWFFYSVQENKNNINRLSIKKIVIIGLGIILLTSAAYTTRGKLLTYSATKNVRKEMFLTAFNVSKNNYWLGAGFGRYGSAVSTRNYSPEYYKYGLNTLYGASPKFSGFIVDQWWAWYIGESGVIGMLCFLVVLYQIFKKLLSIARINHIVDKKLSILAYTSIGGLIYGVGSGFATGALVGGSPSFLIMGLSALTINIAAVTKRAI